MALSSCAGMVPLSSTFISTSWKGAKGGSSCNSIGSGPTLSTDQHPASRCLGVELLTPAPPQAPGPTQARSTALPSPSSSMVVLVTTAWVARRPNNHSWRSDYRTCAQHPEHRGNVNLSKKEMGWKGVVGWDTKLVPARVLWVIVMCLETCLYYHYNQFLATVAWVPSPAEPPSFPQRPAAWPTRASCMPVWVTR